VLSADNRHQLWIPPGFAHGFLTLTDTADFLYKATYYYTPASERAIVWNDLDLAIQWPDGFEPSLSPKDMNAAAFSEAEVFA
jgi:dTDP-4-dehydrorhamnose 3,5-epimerase